MFVYISIILTDDDTVLRTKSVIYSQETHEELEETP